MLFDQRNECQSGLGEIGVRLVDDDRAIEVAGEAATCSRVIAVPEGLSGLASQKSFKPGNRALRASRGSSHAGRARRPTDRPEARPGSSRASSSARKCRRVAGPTNARVMIVKRSSEPLPAMTISGATPCKRAAAWQNAVDSGSG